jgi:hypothetical protein
MNTIAISGIIFACIFGGALFGLFLHRWLPEHHRSKESQDVVKLGIGMVSSMAALVLGLLVASAKGSYDTRRAELIQMSANVVLLDRVLAHYGPDAAGVRSQLRGSIQAMADQIWPEGSSEPRPSAPNLGSEGLYDAIQHLAPKEDAQRALKTQALSLAIGLGQTRWLLYEQSGSSITPAFLVVLVFWLTIVLLSFGAFAPRNTTVVASLFVSALSVSGALFLIMELDQPLHGFIQIPSTPVRKALAQLGR